MQGIFKNHFSLIEKYFSYELEEEELKRFDLLYQQDKEFKEQVNKYEYAKNFVEQKYWRAETQLAEEKHKQLKQLPEQQNKLQPLDQNKTSRWRILSMAAGVLLLVSAIAWFMVPPNIGPAALSQVTFEIAELTTNLDPIHSAVRSSTFSGSNEIWSAYQNKNWDKVIEASTPLHNNPPIYLLTGIAHFQKGNFQKSTEIFEKAKIDMSGMEDNILWWLAASQLNQKDYATAANHLEEIINKNYPTAQKAAEILNQIKTMK